MTLGPDPRRWELNEREDWDIYASRWECDGVPRVEAERLAEERVRRERAIVYPALTR